jgi:hypothetical protein
MEVFMNVNAPRKHLKEVLMSNKEIIIWGRQFELPIDFDIFPGETITDEMRKATDALAGSHNFDEDLDAVKEYCRKSNAAATEGKLDNIFRFVMPQSIYVCNDKKHTVGLMCNYKFDPEHGIVLMYENNKLVEIGPQDIIL